MALNATKPLKSKLPIKKPGNDWLWIQLKYERVPTFCYFYGFFGHNEKFCVKLYDNPDVGEDREFGVWMKAELW